VIQNASGSTLTTGQSRTVRAVNLHLMETYWQVGQQIVEFEQGGQAKAEYGAGLISRLAKDLTLRHGRGFSRSNLKGMRQFYLAYPKSQTLSGFLSWSHVLELLKIDDPLERGFYEQQMVVENWSVRVNQQTSNSVQQFVERYCVFSPKLSQPLNESVTKMNAHLESMGFVWK
jgi:hypothetical protein